MPSENTPLRIDAQVASDGRLEVLAPGLAGMSVTVIVARRSAEFDDLAAASASSLGFWDNPFDDEDWNDA
jgi:hypothetical protein